VILNFLAFALDQLANISDPDQVSGSIWNPAPG
jgi:hypothetical protein